MHIFTRRRALTLLGLAPTALGLAAGVLEACKIEPDKADPGRQQVLRDLVTVVIVPTYQALADDTAALVTAADALEAAPSMQTLSQAQALYRAARADWKSSEAFYFGPAADIALTGLAIDSWPTDGARIDALIAGEGALDASTVATLGANLRGLPGLEYLLFDAAAGDQVVFARLSEPVAGPRRLALIASLARDLAEKSAALRGAWGSLTEGYGHELAEAGIASEIYERQRDAIDEVVTGMLYVAELMVMKKFAKPLGVDASGVPQPELEEAARSDSSLDDLRNNLLGLSSVYLCKRGGNEGRSLSTEVLEANPDVDMRFNQALEAALAAINAVPVPFRIALTTDPAPLELAYQKTRLVKQAIAMELAGALGASIGFGYSDTD